MITAVKKATSCIKTKVVRLEQLLLLRVQQLMDIQQQTTPISSFRPPVAATSLASAPRAPRSSTGRRRSARSASTTRTVCTSSTAVSTHRTTTTATTVSRFARFGASKRIGNNNNNFDYRGILCDF